MVRRSSSWFAVACSVLVVSAQNQSGLLKSLHNIPNLTFVYAGQSGFVNGSEAFNRRFNVDPSAITYPTDENQVSSIVRAAVANQFPVVARSGGHSYIANGLGGTNGHVVVDLVNMSRITVDPITFDTVIQTGNRLGSVALGLNAKGRAMPHGVCPYVGVGGHAGHGGFGFASRMWGLVLDNVKSADVVLANGSLVTATKDHNSDLFWAIRGSSSSFGIVTSYTVQTYKAPSFATIYNYTWHLSYPEAAQALESWQQFVLPKNNNIPVEFGAYMEFRRGPSRGTVTMILWGGWYGPNVASLVSTLKPYIDSVRTAPVNVTFQGNGTYIDAVRILGLPYPLDNIHSAPDVFDTFYVKSLMVPESQPLSPTSWNAFTKYLAAEGYETKLDWFMQIELYGGPNSKINEAPVNSTSFGYRNTLFTFQLYAFTFDHLPPFPTDPFTFVTGVANSITSHSNTRFGAYLNYIDDHLQDWQNRYYGSHYERLQSIKKSVDSHNVFRFPLSVELPAISGAS